MRFGAELDFCSIHGSAGDADAARLHCRNTLILPDRKEPTNWMNPEREFPCDSIFLRHRQDLDLGLVDGRQFVFCTFKALLSIRTKAVGTVPQAWPLTYRYIRGPWLEQLMEGNPQQSWLPWIDNYRRSVPDEPSTTRLRTPHPPHGVDYAVEMTFAACSSRTTRLR